MQAVPEPPLSLVWLASSDNWICVLKGQLRLVHVFTVSLYVQALPVFSYYPLPGCCYGACVCGLFELYSFQFFTDLGLLPDHCSTSWSLGLLLTQCWTSLKELGRQSLSMMLASWLWFHHLCSAEIYNWLLQLEKVKYPFRSPSQKG